MGVTPLPTPHPPTMMSGFPPRLCTEWQNRSLPSLPSLRQEANDGLGEAASWSCFSSCKSGGRAGCGQCGISGLREGRSRPLPSPSPLHLSRPPEHSKGWLSHLSPVSAGEGPNLERILDRELVGVCHTHHVHYSHSYHDL